ncbi:hypothetical protein T4E_7870 [Trichinella pseudospiralis]|uniref:Uncharacterized protein n=1 Tax=Trichinella pseudospiralis TaxID=6337 RepID=A0A0V0Y6J2_TRIPS|nr:hypothetical protein T4E_7870 [Trichinella pseudospiralis]
MHNAALDWRECGDGGGFQFVCRPSLVFGLMNQESSILTQHSRACSAHCRRRINRILAMPTISRDVTLNVSRLDLGVSFQFCNSNSIPSLRAASGALVALFPRCKAALASQRWKLAINKRTSTCLVSRVIES